ncbi:unnamed protein product, partial [Discosporangium mesarthrocarpum]
ERPLAILEGLFDKPPSDLSWGSDGYTLVASGHDGTVTLMRFTRRELGVPVSEAEYLKILQQLYGSDAGNRDSMDALTGTPSMVENPHQLTLEKSREAGVGPWMPRSSSGSGNNGGSIQATPQAAGSPKLYTASIPQEMPVSERQVESRGKGGKKRIRPVLLTVGGDGGVRAGVEVEPSGALGQQRGERIPSSGPRSVIPSTAPTWADGLSMMTDDDLNSSVRGLSNQPIPQGASPGANISGHAWGNKRHRAGGSGSSSPRALPPPAPVAVVHVRPGLPPRPPLLCPPDLMPRQPVKGCLVRQIFEGGSSRAGEAFQPPPRRRVGDVGDGTQGGQGL